MPRKRLPLPAAEDKNERSSDRPTAPPDNTKPPAASAYHTVVYQTLNNVFAVGDPDAMIRKAGAMVERCEAAGIAPQVTAAMVYVGERHKHEVTSTSINEAHESPMREEWEVVVRATNDAVKSATGRTPDSRRGADAVVEGFYDDEKAASFARRLTKAGFVAWYGPKRRLEAATPSAAESDPSAMPSAAEEATRRSFLPPETDLMVNSDERPPRSGNGIVRFDRSGGVYHYIAFVERAPVARLRIKTESGRRATIDTIYVIERERRRGWATKLLKRARQDFDVEHAPAEQLSPDGAKWSAVATEEGRGPGGVQSQITATQQVPWVKVTRDPERYEACLAQAKAIGRIDNGEAVYKLLAETLSKEDQEVFLVVLLDVHQNLRGVCEVARGQRDHVTVAAGDILRPVIVAGAGSFVVVHNHPSGKAKASKADVELTNNIRSATQPHAPDITFVDHVVVGSHEWYSITEEKLHKVG